MPSLKRRVVDAVLDVLFRFKGYDWWYYHLGGLKYIQNNPRARDRFIAEIRHSIEKYGLHPASRPVTLANGLRIASCNLEDWVQFNLYYLRGYSLEEQAIIAKHLSPGDIFIDVGANIGVFSLMAAQTVGPTGRVIAVEPASDTMSHLKSNAALNNLEDRIQFKQCALSDHNGKLTLYKSEIRPNDTGHRSFYQDGEELETVAVRLFDDLVTNSEVTIDRPVGAIKIDVEGAELPVLKGMRGTIMAHRPKLILYEAPETNAEMGGVTGGEIEEFIESCGYKALPGNSGNGRTDDVITDIACVPV